MGIDKNDLQNAELDGLKEIFPNDAGIWLDDIMDFEFCKHGVALWFWSEDNPEIAADDGPSYQYDYIAICK